MSTRNPRINASVTIDKKGYDQIRKLIEDVPQQYRGRILVQGLKAGAADLLDEVKKESLRTIGSEMYARKMTAIQGKYSRKTTPYLVIQPSNSTFDQQRSIGPITMMKRTNYFKIDHFITQGTAGGERQVGRSIRQERSGRKRRKHYNADGSPKMVTKGTSKAGGNFLVQGSGGRVFPVKRIKHPGTDPNYTYDNAAKRGKSFAFAEFESKMLEVSDKLKRRYGLK